MFSRFGNGNRYQVLGHRFQESQEQLKLLPMNPRTYRVIVEKGAQDQSATTVPGVALEDSAFVAKQLAMIVTPSSR